MLKPLGRVIGLLFRDYPAMLIITMICIIISAVVGILPGDLYRDRHELY